MARTYRNRKSSSPMSVNWLIVAMNEAEKRRILAELRRQKKIA